jgi:hypothetical protein
LDTTQVVRRPAVSSATLFFLLFFYSFFWPDAFFYSFLFLFRNISTQSHHWPPFFPFSQLFLLFRAVVSSTWIWSVLRELAGAGLGFWIVRFDPEMGGAGWYGMDRVGEMGGEVEKAYVRTVPYCIIV